MLFALGGDFVCCKVVLTGMFFRLVSFTLLLLLIEATCVLSLGTLFRQRQC